MNPSTQKNYVEQLTWLRGIAALFVVVSHCVRAAEYGYAAGEAGAVMWPLRFFDLGTFGVTLFFALSGCTLYISNKGTIKRTELGSFYIKRFFRIWPAFAVSVLAYICFRPVFESFYVEPFGHWIERQFLEPFTFRELLSYLTLTFNFTGPHDLINNAYWSLPVEFQYYLIFPVLLVSLKYLGLSGPILMSGLLYAVPKIAPDLASSPRVFTMAFSFCGGVFVARLYSMTTWRIPNLIGLCLFSVAVSVVSAVSNNLLSLPEIPFISNPWNFYGVASVGAVFVVLNAGMSLPVRVKAILKKYGDISYSLYLYHNLVIAALMLLLINLDVTGLWRSAALFFLTLAFATMIAQLSYRHVEMPGINFSRKLARNIKSNSAVES